MSSVLASANASTVDSTHKMEVHDICYIIILKQKLLHNRVVDVLAYPIVQVCIDNSMLWQQVTPCISICLSLSMPISL